MFILLDCRSAEELYKAKYCFEWARERKNSDGSAARATAPKHAQNNLFAAPASSNSSDSKYSAARVRERISSDGTVAPVMAPNRTREGLYVRPPGQGMEWDAVKGIWVPGGFYSRR